MEITKHFCYYITTAGSNYLRIAGDWKQNIEGTFYPVDDPIHIGELETALSAHLHAMPTTSDSERFRFIHQYLSTFYNLHPPYDPVQVELLANLLREWEVEHV